MKIVMEDQEGLVWIIYVAGYVGLICIPAANVLRRVGFNGWWSILLVVPLLGLIMLWVFAFIQWPRDQQVR